MLSAKDCIDYCELSEEAILSIAKHEGLPDVIAAAFGQCLSSKNGVSKSRELRANSPLSRKDLHTE